LKAMPGTLGQYCAGSTCAAATKDFAGDVVAVVNKLGRGLGTRILGAVVDADLNPGLAAELPAAFHSARGGDMLPLLHAMLLGTGGAAAQRPGARVQRRPRPAYAHGRRDRVDGAVPAGASRRRARRRA